MLLVNNSVPMDKLLTYLFVLYVKRSKNEKEQESKL